MKPLRIVIIGSGLGGLAAGIRLVSEGYQVTILEKNTLPGGCLRTKEINGFRFNYGAEVITAPFLFDQLFEQAGKNRHDYFDLLPFEPVFQAIFPGEKRFAFFSDPQKTLQWNNLFSQEEERALLSYFQANEEIFNDVFFDYCSKPIQDSQLRSFFPFLPQKLQNQKSSLQVAEAYYKTPELQLVFGFWPLLAGGDPRESGSLFRIIPSIFSHWGASIPVGGMKRVLNSLLSVFLEQGGEILYNSEVQEIQIFNRTVSGVRLIDGSIYHADIVISDVDALTTFRFLIDSDKNKYSSVSQAKTKNPGISVFSYHLGLDCTLEEKISLAGCNFIFPNHFDAFLSDLFHRKTLSSDPFFLLKIPAKTDLYAAPHGFEALSVVIPVPNLASDISWERESYLFRTHVLELIQDYFVTDLRKHILFEDYSDPVRMWTENRSYLGAAFSAMPGSAKKNDHRFPNRCKDIRNLYLVGAGTHPGPSIPGVLMGAATAVSQIKADFS
jgi:phytoene desaturase